MRLDFSSHLACRLLESFLFLHMPLFNLDHHCRYRRTYHSFKSMILLLISVLGAPLSDSCITTKNSKDLEQTTPYARSVRLYFCSVATDDRFVSALWLQQSRLLP